MIEFTEAFKNAPRFGHPADFSLLFGTSTAGKVDYVLGTIFIGTFIFTVFLAWLALLVIFTCLGPRKVGFLSGFQMKHSWWKDRYQICAIVRSIFIFSCLVVLTGAALMTFSFGLNNLKSATSDMREITNSFAEIEEDGEILMKTTLFHLGDFQGFRDTIINELRADSFCFDKDLDAKSGEPVHELRNDLVQDLYDLEDFGSTNFTELHGHFEKIQKDIGTLNYYITLFGFHSWQLYFFMVTFSTIPLFMLLGTSLAWVGRSSNTITCLNTWFHLPIFLASTAVLWSFVSFHTIGAVMNAGKSELC